MERNESPQNQFSNEDIVAEQIARAWYKYDLDRNGYLDMNETFNFLKNFLAQQGQNAPTFTQFSRFFDEFDINQDGYISKNEMAVFFRKFLKNAPINQPNE